MNYKEYKKIYIGMSDVATLIFVGCGNPDPDKEMQAVLVSFGGDGIYYAYLVDENAEIGEHYHQVASFEHWLTIYDDSGKTFNQYAKKIIVYRAGSSGTIIQVIR